MPPETYHDPQLENPNLETQRRVDEPPRRSRASAVAASLAVLLLLLAIIGTVLEYFGVTNVVPHFGRMGRPYLELGVWEPAEFTDVPDDYWARPYIERLGRQGIIRGFPNGEFRPEDTVTRAEFAAMLRNAFIPSPTPGFVRSIGSVLGADDQDRFADVPSDFWAYPAIADIRDAGFLSGFPNGEFRPNQELTRVNAVVAIANGLELEPSLPAQDVLQRVYVDSADIPDYAVNPVAAVTEAGLRLDLTNPNQFNPNQPATRAEVAALLYQALERTGMADPIVRP